LDDSDHSIATVDLATLEHDVAADLSHINEKDKAKALKQMK